MIDWMRYPIAFLMVTVGAILLMLFADFMSKEHEGKVSTVIQAIIIISLLVAAFSFAFYSALCLLKEILR